MRLPGIQRRTLDQLISLVNRLHSETNDFLDNPSDEQLWYNRGYANGVATTLNELGYIDYLNGKIERDPPNIIDEHKMLTWGKAYQHGAEVGSKETRDVIGPAPGSA